MSKPCGKCKKAECEECPEWIFTFADLVMLMMGFFVILWVLKPAPGKDDPKANEELVKLAAKIREAFDYLPDPHSKDPVDIQMLLNKLEKMKIPQGPGDGGKTKLPRKGAEGTDPEVTTVRQGKQAIVGGRLLFEPGQAALTPDTTQSLVEIVEQIRGHRNIVLVKGHTSLDDFAEGANSQQQMDLSIRRAQAVADYLRAHGVESEILRVQGCSTFEPVIQREYRPNSQSLNRRVEVEATATLVEERQDRREMGATAPAAKEASTAVEPGH